MDVKSAENSEKLKDVEVVRLKDPYEWKKMQKQNIHEELIV